MGTFYPKTFAELLKAQDNDYRLTFSGGFKNLWCYWDAEQKEWVIRGQEKPRVKNRVLATAQTEAEAIQKLVQLCYR